MSAQKYVMAHFPDNRRLIKLSKRYDSKLFLPHLQDVRNLFHYFGREVPVLRTRKGAIPAAFQFLSTLKKKDLKSAKDIFGPPASLGPIADAILNMGRK